VRAVFSSGWILLWEEELRFRLRSWRVYRGQSSNELRFFLSHFLRCPASLKLSGPETVRRPSYGNARFVCAIPSSVTDAAVSRRMINITTGLGSVAVTVLVAARPSPSFRYFLCLTRITACWHGCKHYNAALGSTAPGNKPRPHSRTPIVCLIPPRSAVGRATWTPPNQPFPFCGKRLPA
jgi:hypothetical protein